MNYAEYLFPVMFIIVSVAGRTVRACFSYKFCRGVQQRVKAGVKAFV